MISPQWVDPGTQQHQVWHQQETTPLLVKCIDTLTGREVTPHTIVHRPGNITLGFAPDDNPHGLQVWLYQGSPL